MVDAVFVTQMKPFNTYFLIVMLPRMKPSLMERDCILICRSSSGQLTGHDHGALFKKKEKGQQFKSACRSLETLAMEIFAKH
ncbi:hypothetical protein U9M48_032003, partial [Paspalum notatum var. saurae]